MKLTVNGLFRYFIVFALVLLFAYLIFLVSNRGIADIYAYQARTYINHWKEKNTEPTTRQWNKAYSLLSQALTLAPKHSGYLEIMAGLYQWQALLPKMKQEKIMESLHLSKIYYLKTIKLRPSWPYAWGNYALLKLQLNELDDKYLFALGHAIKLGQWEPRVQQLLAQATLPIWPKLDKATQELAVKNVFRGLHTNFQLFVQLAKQYNMLVTLCTMLQRDKVVKRACSDRQLR